MSKVVREQTVSTTHAGASLHVGAEGEATAVPDLVVLESAVLQYPATHNNNNLSVHHCFNTTAQSVSQCLNTTTHYLYQQINNCQIKTNALLLVAFSCNFLFVTQRQHLAQRNMPKGLTTDGHTFTNRVEYGILRSTFFNKAYLKLKSVSD
jgi:hypothetical protein